MVDLDALRVSPSLSFGRYSVDLFGQLAVSVDAGWDRVRFDGALPLVGVETYGTKGDVQTEADFDRIWGLSLPPYMWDIGTWEAGARWLPHRRNAVRVGWVGAGGLALGWRWQGDHIEAAVDVIGRYVHQVPRVQAHVGYRF